MSASAGPASEPLAAGIRNCAGEQDRTKRLSCFDALASSLPKVEADAFGLTADIERKRAPAAERQASEAVLPGKIVALAQTPRGEIIFTLDNHQVWMQSEIEPSKKFSLGDAVRIEHGAMGSYWLAADNARKTKVKRVN